MTIKTVLLSTATIGFIASNALAMEPNKIETNKQVKKILKKNPDTLIFNANNTEKFMAYIATMKEIAASTEKTSESDLGSHLDAINSAVVNGRYWMGKLSSDENALIINPHETSNLKQAEEVYQHHNNALWVWQQGQPVTSYDLEEYKANAGKWFWEK